jgi:nucleoside-diphosphate-sugar epimerase
MKVLVTGATGFVGRSLVPQLLEAGHAVHCAVRRQTDSTAEGATTVVVGDLDSRTSWTDAMDGVDAVIHLAARVHVLEEQEADPLAAFRRVNRDGTRGLARSCRRGVRFVYCSSIKAVVDEAHPTPIDEHTPSNPTTAYGRSKLEGELEVAAAAETIGFDWIAIRPPLVFGEGMAGNMRRLLVAIRRGMPLPLASLRNRRSLIYVENLASALVSALAADAPSNIALPISDGPPRSTPELCRAFAEAMGRRARLIPVPAVALKYAAALTGRSDLWLRLGGNLEIVQETRERLGWTPRVSFDDAAARTVKAYQAGVPDG